MFFILTHTLSLTAQTAMTKDSIAHYRLGEIVILGEILPDNSILPVYEIKKSTIQQLDATSASDLLEYTPGLYFSLSGKNEHTFRIRGFEQRQVNVYLDGIPISVPFDGVVDISQLGGDSFENVRISKGVSSVLYGTNTLGGSVNIITTLPGKDFSYRLRAEGSHQGRWFGNMQVSGGWNLLRYAVSLSREDAPDFTLPADRPPLKNQTGDTRNNSTFTKNSGTIKLHYGLHPAHRLGFHLNIIQNKFHIPPNALEDRPRYWRFPEWQKNVISLNSQHILSDQFILRSVWYYDNYQNVLKAYRDASYSDLRFTSIYDDYSLGAILYPQIHYLKWGGTRGIISYKRDVHREKAADSDPYSKFSMETVTAGFEQEVRLSGHWQVLLGAEGSYLNPLVVDEGELREPILLGNAQLALKYSVFDQLNFEGSLGTKSRFPTLKELYSERLGRNMANPDLKHERAMNMEAGMRWRDDVGSLNISIFQNYLDDHIVNTRLEGGEQQFQNIGEAVFRGVEIETRRKVGNLDIITNYTYLNARNNTSERTADFLPYRPTHRINGLLHWAITQKLGVHGEGIYTADQYYQNPQNLDWEKLNDFAVINLKIGFRINRLIYSYFRTNNLFDSFYFSEYGIPMPGRELILGLRISG
jgi:outer membrane cobalamin receptor